MLFCGVNGSIFNIVGQKDQLTLSAKFEDKIDKLKLQKAKIIITPQFEL